MAKVDLDREPPGTLAAEIKAMSDEEVFELTADFPLTTTPMAHQARAMLIAAGEPHYLFAADMGTGKTFIGLAAFAIRRKLDGAQHALIACPPIVLRQWRREIRKHSTFSAAFVEGDTRQKKDVFFNSNTDIVVVSIAWLTRQFTAASKDKELDRALERRFADFDALIIDEAHKVSSHNSVGFRGFMKYSRVNKYRYLLTGTPLTNNSQNVFSLYNLLDRGQTFGTNFVAFRKHFFTEVLKWKGPRCYRFYNLRASTKPELRDKIWKKGIRWQESECTGLPPKRYIKMPVQLYATERAKYDEVVNEYKAADEPMPTFKLMRITAGIGEKNAPKLEALLHVVDSALQEDKQVIVWHQLIEEGRMIEKELKATFKKTKIFSVRGETTDKQKNTALEYWATGKPGVLIAHPEALGIGVDLQTSTLAVFYSTGYAANSRLQCEKRIHRTGQTKPCTYIDIFVEDSIDEVILKGLKKAIDTQQNLLRDVEGEVEEDIVDAKGTVF